MPCLNVPVLRPERSFDAMGLALLDMVFETVFRGHEEGAEKRLVAAYWMSADRSVCNGNGSSDKRWACRSDSAGRLRAMVSRSRAASR